MLIDFRHSREYAHWVINFLDKRIVVLWTGVTCAILSLDGNISFFCIQGWQKPGFYEYCPAQRVCQFEIHKIAVCFLWLSLPDDNRVTDEALLAETT